MDNTNEKMTAKQWMALIGMTFSVFVFNTSEFMPIGLLTDIGTDLHVSLDTAGMLISVYAWFVALLSLPLMLLVCKMEYRKLLLCVLALFVVSHVASSFASNYAMLMASRIGVACAHSVFWSIASPMAVRVVPRKYKSLALSMIIAGTSVAMIVGLPLGRVIGLLIGWRMTFLSIAIAAFTTMIYLSVVFPKVSNRDTFNLKKLPHMLRSHALIGIYIITIIISTSYYIGYSYIEPFLAQVGGLNETMVTIALTAFGIAGMLGGVIFSRYYEAYRRLFVIATVVGMSLCMLLLRPAALTIETVMLLIVLWGISATAFNVAMQAEIIKITPASSTAVAMSIFSGIFNFGIGGGTLIGGIVCTRASISYIGYVGGALAAIGVVFTVWKLVGVLSRTKPVQL